jgi:hypothetical protein
MRREEAGYGGLSVRECGYLLEYFRRARAITTL